MAEARLLWTPRAWLRGGWREGVLLCIGPDGRWSAVTPGVATPPPGAAALPGPLLPALVNAHSHAFQRAFAGLAERREGANDDFWSWRDRMYRVAASITPEQLRAIAAQLYVELLRGGYTQVCEFHYLQHGPDGARYPDPLGMSWALADAAADAGIGLTVLPVLYERAGFSQPDLRADQRRFAMSAKDVCAARAAIARSGRARVSAGVAIHSLRAAAPASITSLRDMARTFDGPIHIHVSEQQAEVEDCMAAMGVRLIEWLAREGLLDSRWQLVHATHATPGEIEAVAKSGAAIVLCPSTEANLGDGLTDLSGWLGAGVPMTIGSDSHVTRDWREELRLADYGQRLALRRRNVAAAPAEGYPSTAGRLFARAEAGSAAAAGEPAWGLVAGARADALLVDETQEPLLGIPPAQLLDALVFSSPGRAWRDVMVGGEWVIRGGRHADEDGIAARFQSAMSAIWGDRPA
jgi:formimidoylglutamate deiminase